MRESWILLAILALAGCEGEVIEEPEAQTAEVMRADPDWWGQVSAAMRDGAYQVGAYGEEVRFANPAQGLTARIEADGTMVLGPDGAEKGPLRKSVAAWEVRMRTVSVGRAGERSIIEDEAPVVRVGGCAPGGKVDADGDCLREAQVAREGSVEWWRNGEDGIEQGWTLWEPGEIEVAIDCEVEVDYDGAGATITSGTGRLRYEGLVAWDAEGRGIEAWMCCVAIPMPA